MGNCTSLYHNIRSSPPLPKEEEFINQVIDLCSKNMVLDASRRDFLESQALIVHQLIPRKLVMLNGFRRTLLGEKFIGKTLLLLEFASALKAIGSQHLLIFFLRCFTNTNTPREVLCKALKIRKNTKWEKIKGKLDSLGLRVLFIIDDFDIAFNQSFAMRCHQFICDIAYIGKDNDGYFHCLLSGNIKYMPKLIMDQLTMEEAIENYLICPSINLSEYLFLTILPFTNPRDLAIVNREAYNQDKFET